MIAKYKVGDILYENMPENSAARYKMQLYTIANYIPKNKNYMLTGTLSNEPRFYTEQDLDMIFKFHYKVPR